ncbi:MAG TPA: hypothetical protein DDX14_01430, partial [Cyanobacteria bacterium UBA9579]|nr:hypothetical protein [Cyanobacteria bacterium UBA9579]
PFDIIKSLCTKDTHAPLYFILLHFWMKIFGIHDIIIRLFSVIHGILIIPIFYLIGKEISSRKAGFLLALFASFNSFLIYYSQEVRFYALAALFGAISILFLVKVIKKPKLRNYIGLILANVGVLYTFTIGFIFVFCEAFIILAYFCKNRRWPEIKHFIYAQLVTLTLFIPYLAVIIQQYNAQIKGYISSFSFFESFNYASILLLLQNWFSPYVSGIVYPNLHYYEELLLNGIKPEFIIFAVMPVTICLIGIIKTLQKRNIVSLVFGVGVLLIFIEIILTFMGKLAITPRYAILAFPAFLTAAVYGLVSFKSRVLSGLLISLLIFTNLYYLAFSPHSIQRYPSSQGYGTVARILNKYDLNSGDILLMPMEGRFLGKYYSLKDINLLDFTVGDICLDSNILLGAKLTDILTKENAHDKLRNYILSPKIPYSFENYIKTNVVDKLERGRYFIIVMPAGLKPFDENLLTNIAVNDKIYKNISLYYLLTSKAAINLNKIVQKYFSTEAIIKKDEWEIYILKKV